MVSFRLTTGTVTWAFVADIMSPKGNALSNAYHNFIAFLLGLVFPYLENMIGLAAMFFLFTLAQIFCMLYLFPRLIETKNKT